jgi:hypothetical protein
MNTNELQTKDSLILGQKYAYATISLILGITCFVNLVGLEKAILAVVFGWLALRANPAPALKEHRIWARTGVILGTAALLFVPLVIIFNFDRIREFIDMLSTMNGGR